MSNAITVQEGTGAVQNFKKALERNLQYDGAVMDNDSTTVAWLREQVDETIVDEADINHTRVNNGEHLRTVKAKHVQFTQRLLDKCERLFRKAIKSHVGDAKAIEKNLKAIPRHAYGDHEYCEFDWCTFL